MCGLTGYMGSRNPDPMKLRLLLMDNEERGRHSTGLYGSRLMRKVGGASLFIQDPNFDTVAKADIVIGHTRHATAGAHTKDNAHPFLISKDLIGTHNGWLVNSYEMEQKYGEEVKADVDSHTLYKVIGKADDPTAFSIGEGAMALAFKFKGDGYLYRRESRPLFIAKGDGGIYYSSKQEGLRLCGFRKIFVLTPHVLYKISNGIIVDRIDIPHPRVAIQESTYMGSWEHGVSPALKEELTGKKPIVPVQSNIGAQKSQTENHLKIEAKPTIEEVSQMMITRLSKYGSGLSESVRKELYRFLTDNDNRSIISKIYNYDHEYSTLDIYSSDKDKVNDFLSKTVIENSFITRKLIVDVAIKESDSVAKDKADFILNLYGFDDEFGIRALNGSRFIATMANPSDRYYRSGKVAFYEPTDNSNMILGSTTLNGERNWVTLTLADAEIKGVLLSCTVCLTAGCDNEIDVFIPMRVYDNLRGLCAVGDSSTHYIKDAYVSRDVTRISEIMKMNEGVLYKAWENLPFLKSTSGHHIKKLGTNSLLKDITIKLKKMKESNADPKEESKEDTCCAAQHGPWLKDSEVWDNEDEDKDVLDLSRFYVNIMHDFSNIYDDMEEMKTVIAKKTEDVGTVEALSNDHFALLETLRNLKDISIKMFYLKTNLRKTHETLIK